MKSAVQSVFNFDILVCSRNPDRAPKGFSSWLAASGGVRA